MAFKTNRITYQQVMAVWDLTRPGAITRLNVIRERLGKKLGQTLNVFEYCKAEDITVEQFDEMMKRSQQSL